MAAYFSLGDLLLLPFLIGYTAWWSYDLRKGSRVRRGTLGLHIAIYALAAFWVWGISYTEIVEAGGTLQVIWVWFLLLPVLLYVIVRAGLRFGRRRVVVFGSSAESWRYRGPASIAVLWLALYLVRYALEDGLLGGFSVLFPSPLPHGAPPNGVPLLVFAPVVFAVGCLYLLSFGFLLGVTLSVWGHHRRAVSAASTSELASDTSRPASRPPSPGVVRPSASERASPSRPERSPTTAGTGAGISGPPGRALRGTRGSMPPGELPAPSNPSRYCARCGSRFERGGNFCSVCGAPR